MRFAINMIGQAIDAQNNEVHLETRLQQDANDLVVYGSSGLGGVRVRLRSVVHAKRSDGRAHAIAPQGESTVIADLNAPESSVASQSDVLVDMQNLFNDIEKDVKKRPTSAITEAMECASPEACLRIACIVLWQHLQMLAEFVEVRPKPMSIF